MRRGFRQYGVIHRIEIEMRTVVVVLAVSTVLGCSAGSTGVPCADWARAAPMAQARVAHSMTELDDGSILVAGGRTPQTAATKSTEIWEPTSKQWRSGPDMLQARVGHAAVRLSDGRLLIAGGTDTSGAALATAELYDPAADSFAAASEMNGPHAAARMILVADGRPLIMSGDPTPESPSTEFYDPDKDSWRVPGDPGPLLYPSMTRFFDDLVAVVGHTPDGHVQAHEFWYAAYTRGESGEQFEGIQAPGCLEQGHQRAMMNSDTAVLAGGGGCLVTLHSRGPSFSVHVMQHDAHHVIPLGEGAAYIGTSQHGQIFTSNSWQFEPAGVLPPTDVAHVLRRDGRAMTSGGLDATGAPITATYETCE